MTVKAIDWTQGDVGHVAVALRDGTCRIDWGDGRTSSVKSRISDESMIFIQEDVRSHQTFLRLASLLIMII